MNFYLSLVIMKLDLSGLESTRPQFASNSELPDGVLMAPSFDLPTTPDVSCVVVVVLAY